MSAASEALAEVRGWLCDHLSEGDAGNVCGMLSAVSRHITRLETENARLDQKRIGLHAEVERLSGIIHRQRKQLVDVQDALERRNAEYAKLRELAHDLRLCSVESNCLRCEHGRFCDLRLDERYKELGIEED